MTNKLHVRGRKLTLSYTVNQFMKGWTDWRWFYYQFTNHVVPKYFSHKRNSGVYVWKEDWDNLIILDGCRYDIFAEKLNNSNIHGKMEKRISRGSSTEEFLLENFGGGRKFPDIVYITANPFVHTMLDPDTFFKTANVWKGSWDEENGTVMPSEVVKAALRTYIRYPHKRIIVHFMQPHSPFIGAYSKKGNFWQVALSEGKNEVMKAYSSNLDLVFPYVKKLLGKLEGKTVVTSDHGEACGERATFMKIPIYGHPGGVHIPSLLEVPWLIIIHNRPLRETRRRIKDIVNRLKKEEI